MSTLFRERPAKQSPFTVKRFKGLSGRPARPGRSRGRAYAPPGLTAALALGLFLCSVLAAPPARAGQTVVIDGVSGGVTVIGNSVPPITTPMPSNLLNPNYNTVIVKSGTLVNVIGGYAMPPSGPATAIGNSVTIYGGTFEDVTGGAATSSAASTGPVTATGNSVTIYGGTFHGVTGGSAQSFPGTPTTASGNSVTIYGGTVSYEVCGGRVGTGNAAATATHNTVTISGRPNLGAATICGGDSTVGGGDAFTGNTLNLKTSISVFSVQHFENYNFHLPATLGAGGTMLTINSGGEADLTGSGGRSSQVSVSRDGAASPLKTGDRIILIDAGAGTLTTNGRLNTRAAGQNGVTLKYGFDLEVADKRLTATVTGVEANEAAKALPQGFLSGLAQVNQGGDLVAGPGLAEAAAAAQGARTTAQGAVTAASAGEGAAGGAGTAGFGVLSAGALRHNNPGAHVDTEGLSLMAGLAKGWDSDLGRLTLGSFLELGDSSYDTYNSFDDSPSVHGQGDARQLGGGFLGRLDYADYGPGRFYSEASFRVGGIHNKYWNDDLQDGQGRRAEYDSETAYYGFHLGQGYLANINEKAYVDLYGQYFWTRVEGDSVTLSTGDPVTFKDLVSSRLRLGSRIGYAATEYLSPYIGAAYEYELEGQAKAASHGYALDSPNSGGGTGLTGVWELGLNFKPSPARPLSFDFGVRTYVGQKEGVTGSLRANWEF